LTKKLLLPLSLLVLLAAAAGYYLLRAPGTDGPSMVLISIDTLRADHLSAYGYHRTTPNIDALAAQGVLFRRAHTTAPWTLPAHMSLMTGRFPSGHGVVNDDHALAPGVSTLAQALTRAGYRCAGFVSHHYLSPDYGFDRGFDESYHYRQYVNDPDEPEKAVRGAVTVQAAIDYLEESRGDRRPYFLFVHLFDPHWTYNAPAPYAGRYASADYAGPIDGTLGNMMPFIASKQPLPEADLRQLVDRYDEEIAYVDDLVGRLVARIRGLPGGDRTAIVLTSDHGEEFLDHGSLGHSVTLYREQIHVPLIVVAPALAQVGGEVSARVRGVDVAPTLARIAGVPESDPLLAGIDGVPLQIHLGTPRTVPELPVIVETTRYGHPRVAVIVDDHKAIAPMDYDFVGQLFTPQGPKSVPAATWRRGLELYDLTSDPMEQAPLPRDETLPALILLREWLANTWRGLQLEIRPAGEWAATLEFPSDTVWLDEAWIDDGARSRRLEPADNRLTLSGLKAGGTYRVGLPIEIETGRQYLKVTALRGSATYTVGRQSIELAEGRSERFDLSLSELRAVAPDKPAPGNLVRLRTRPFSARVGTPPLDPELEKVLRSLGYVGQ